MFFWSRPSFWLLTEKELRLTGPPHRTLTNILYSFDYDVRKSKSDFNAKPHGLSENIPYPAINYFYFRVDIISFCSGVLIKQPVFFLTKSSVLKLKELRFNRRNQQLTNKRNGNYFTVYLTLVICRL